MVHKFFSGAKKPADIAGFFMPAIRQQSPS